MRVVLACLIVLLAPSAAVASDARVTGYDVEYVASPGEANVLSVSDDGTDVIFTDTAATITPGDGCRADGADTVRCKAPVSCDASCFILGGEGGTPTVVSLQLGDLDDRVTTDEPLGHLKATLGPGNDDFTARGVTQNVVDGGSGDDRMLGGDGNDRFTGGSGADFAQGFGGEDTFAYDEPERASGVRTAIDGAGDEGDEVHVEDLVGTPGADRLRGNGAANVIDGVGGSDDIACGGGEDYALTADLRAAAVDCEHVAHSAASDALIPSGGRLRADGGVVHVAVAIAAVSGYADGRVVLAGAGGTRLGRSRTERLDGDDVLDVVLNRTARRRLRRRAELAVRLTGVATDVGPAVSYTRALGTLRR